MVEKSLEREIRKAYECGHSLRAIALDYELSHETVRKIVRGKVRTTPARVLDGRLRSLRTPLHVHDDDGE